MLEQLYELLRIESVSSAGAHPQELRAALDLAAAGELGVNVRVLADGEEEIGGHSVIHHLAAVEGDFAAAVIFDGSMVDAARPAITTGLRGLAGAQLRLTTGRRELH